LEILLAECGERDFPQYEESSIRETGTFSGLRHRRYLHGCRREQEQKWNPCQTRFSEFFAALTRLVPGKKR
jgi:hypothetical protein